MKELWIQRLNIIWKKMTAQDLIRPKTLKEQIVQSYVEEITRSNNQENHMSRELLKKSAEKDCKNWKSRMLWRRKMVQEKKVNRDR